MSQRSDNSSISQLEEQEKKEGTLPPLQEFYLKLLRVQSEAEQCLGVPEVALTSKAINARIEQGQPLLAFDELDIKWSLLRDIAEKVTGVFIEYPELFGPAIESFKESGAGHFFTKEVVEAWFEGLSLPTGVVADNVNEPLLESIIQATLSPFLVSYSKALLNKVDSERWRRRYCPVCGGDPDFASLDKEYGARWLLCSRCNAEWLFQRMECPYCGSGDQNTLAYFTDDEGLYRLYVCEQCKRYLKTIDLRHAESEVSLPLERLLTLDLDAQAKERGYSPGGGGSTRSRGDKAG